MKAAVFHGPGKALTIEQVAEPSPSKTEMLVKVSSD